MKFLHKIKNFWLWFWFDKTMSPKVGKKTKTPETEKVLAKIFVRIFVKCPLCDERFIGHKVADLAVRTYSSKNKDELSELKRKSDELYKNLKQKRWTEIVNKDEFDLLEDALGVYAIKCPNKSLYWVVLFEPYSIDEQIELSEWNKVEAAEAIKLLKLIPDKNWSMIS
jgi:hypothetical protein